MKNKGNRRAQKNRKRQERKTKRLTQVEPDESQESPLRPESRYSIETAMQPLYTAIEATRERTREFTQRAKDHFKETKEYYVMMGIGAAFIGSLSILEYAAHSRDLRKEEVFAERLEERRIVVRGIRSNSVYSIIDGKDLSSKVVTHEIYDMDRSE